MYKSIKYIGSVFLVLTFSINSSTEKPWYEVLISEYPIQCYIIGATAALVIGTLSYNYYQAYTLNHEQLIEDCRSIYKNIYNDVQNYHDFYRSDVQISDWDLKEIIIDNQESYPFMMYYKSLIESSYRLHNHLVTLNKQLTKIDAHKKYLLAHNHSETTVHLQEMFLQLEIKGKQLQNYTIETITLVMILKNRIKLFKEYNDDCHSWSHAGQSRKH